ncbi:hypothetical protein [Enterococcus pallens]|uniref:Lipoprotein n=1 Tax=Enterococcus pallens ATCC BAA-351 TaxID=1158607 RepID=R2T114_9ENTE|nr:hypothetical protein [Enterococcus pallens]EOH93924.1 hypothetical protein UAU_02620 [Enterococcus pallens ATCC BAA-351]EOU24764.1 hypothetical protein I588_00751 [Enterococcus pallens ATCC BAA-351]
MKKFRLGKFLMVIILAASIVLLGACKEDQPDIREILTEDSAKWQLVSEQGLVELTFAGNGIAEFLDEHGKGQVTYEVNERQTEIEFQFMQDIAPIKSGIMKNVQVESEKLITGEYFEKGSEASVSIELKK